MSRSPVTKMAQGCTEFTQHPVTATASITACKQPTQARTASALASEQHCDILLNNFQIKNKRYRVLFNYDHIVWEPLVAKRSVNAENKLDSKKEAVYESEQLSCHAAYGSNTSVLHINDLIRVAKGNTKAAALHCTATQPNSEFGIRSTTTPAQQQANTSSSPTEQYLALWYAVRIVNSATDCNRWQVHKLVLYNMDAYVVRQWYALLNKTLDNNSATRLRVRRLLVFINPYGGRKQGLQVFERHCKPLFQLADIDASCIISQRSNQIRDILLSHDLTPFDAICCVGGDGTVAEVINGLIFRAIREAGMDARQPPYVPKPALPIAIIPAGSTDTVAYSLHGTSDVRTAAIHLILGQRRGLDICSVQNRDGIIRFCASLLSYGYLGDVAAKSERYRWMGTKRYEFAGIKAFLTNNGYEADLRLLQPTAETKQDTDGIKGGYNASDTICCTNCMHCSAAGVAKLEFATKRALMESAAVADMDAPTDNDELPSSSSTSMKSCEDNHNATDNAQFNTPDVMDVAFAGHLRHKLSSPFGEFQEINDIKDIETRNCDSNLKAVNGMNQLEADNKIKHPTEDAIATNPAEAQNVLSVTDNNDIYAGMDDESMPTSQWKTINGKFFMISGANITCACTRSPNGIARFSHLGDGYLDLILVRKTSLLNNVRLLINMMGRNGDIRNLPFVETYRTKRFHFRSPNANPEDQCSVRGSCQPIAASADGYADNDVSENFSHWNCDGEVISDQELTMISHCQLIDVFMRGPHTYNKPVKDGRRSLFCCCCCCGAEN